MFSASQSELDQKRAPLQGVTHATRASIAQSAYVKTARARRVAEADTMHAFRAARTRRAIALVVLGCATALSRLALRIDPNPAIKAA